MSFLEKLEDCPVCGASLRQWEYDFQRHGGHWNGLPILSLPILSEAEPSIRIVPESHPEDRV